MNKMFLIFKKSPIATILNIISFVFFIVMFLYINLYSLKSYFFKGLIFIIPFISYGFILYFSAKGNLNKLPSNIISIIMIFVLGVVMFFSFIFIIIDEGTTVTTDEEKYQKVLRITNYPQNELTKYFPSEIPDDAKNIIFYYHPAFAQGGQVTGLKFTIDSKSIDSYINDFKNKAIWTGNINGNINDYGIYSHLFSIFGYEQLPEDFTIYVFESENNNHGKLSLIALSEEKNEIIFYVTKW